MKKVSAFQIILLAVFGALAVAGVLVFALAVGGGSKTSSIGAVTIWGTLDASAFSGVIDQFSQQNQQLSEVTYQQQDPSTFESNLDDALASGAGPNLFVMSGDEAIADSDKVYQLPFTSLSQQQYQSLFISAGNVFLASSSVTAIPFAVDPLVLYWNEDLLASAGYAQPPQYWDQLPDMAQKLTQKTPDGQITRAAIALGTYQNIDDAKYILAALIMQAGGTITTLGQNGQLTATLAQGSSGSTQDPALSALEFYTEFADPSQPEYSWNGAMQDAQSAFAAGEAAMYIGFASEEPVIAALNPNLDFAAAPLPQLRGSATNVDAGVVYGFAIPKTAQNGQGALDAAFLLDSASTSAALSQALGIPSARRDVLSAGAQGDMQLFDQMALITKTWDDPDPAQTDALFQAMIEDTVSGAVTADQAVSRAQQQLSSIIGQ